MENFIYKTTLPDVDLCDEIIKYFNNSPNKHRGRVYCEKGGDTIEQPNIKQSTDLSLDFFTDKEIIEKYIGYLYVVVNEYIEKFKFVNENSKFGVTEQLNIQHYAPGESFSNWHCERGTPHFPVNTRHLVFITYLNDVTDAGETEFYYQKLKITPKRVDTIIFPVDWTYTHRGITSPTQDKYIITGWCNYLP